MTDANPAAPPSPDAAAAPAAPAVPPSPTDRPGLARGTRVLLTLAAAAIVFAGIWFARDILAPVAVAAIVVIITHPVGRVLEQRGWPRWLATTAVIVVAYLILGALAAMLVFASAQFVAMLPEYADDLEQTADSIAAFLQSIGLGEEAGQAASSALDPATLVDVATAIANAVLGFATAFFFVLAYVIFMAADASRFARDGLAFGTQSGDAISAKYFTGVRRYYVVNATFGLVVAVLDGLLLLALGVPIPLVWAILAFVTNFIPNIGFVIGVIPPAVLALVVGGWPLALIVILAYSVINVVLQVLVQPKFVSDAVNLSLTLTFFSVVFWALVIGPIGAILCIPLTLLVRALLLEPGAGNVTLRRLSGESMPAPPADSRAAPSD